MILQIVTDLIGQIVEVRDRSRNYGIGDGALRCRVRAAYVNAHGMNIVVEPEEPLTRVPVFSSGLEPGELLTFTVNDVGVRVVQQCADCGLWAHPSQLESRQVAMMGGAIVVLVHRRHVGGCRTEHPHA